MIWALGQSSTRIAQLVSASGVGMSVVVVRGLGWRQQRRAMGAPLFMAPGCVLGPAWDRHVWHASATRYSINLVNVDAVAPLRLELGFDVAHLHLDKMTARKMMKLLIHAGRTGASSSRSRAA